MKIKNPVNLTLLSISFLIAGVLGIIFITQMEILPGWTYNRFQENYNPMHFNSINAESDLNGDGINDIILYSDMGSDNKIPYISPNTGYLIALNPKNGEEIWSKRYDNPIKKVFPIGDINNDGFNDYIINIASVLPYWNKTSGDWYETVTIPNKFHVFMVNGKIMEIP
ncbi:MAG: hypothetical protein ACTSRH_10425 [Promethearchaeota archaeon]